MNKKKAALVLIVSALLMVVAVIPPLSQVFIGMLVFVTGLLGFIMVGMLCFFDFMDWLHT